MNRKERAEAYRIADALARTCGSMGRFRITIRNGRTGSTVHTFKRECTDARSALALSLRLARGIWPVEPALFVAGFTSPGNVRVNVFE